MSVNQVGVFANWPYQLYGHSIGGLLPDGAIQRDRPVEHYVQVDKQLLASFLRSAPNIVAFGMPFHVS